MNTTEENVNYQEIQDFRLYLQAELLRRCRANRNYSLRAFARHLEIEPSALSKILSGKRGISKAMLFRLGSKLGVDQARIQEFEEKIKMSRANQADKDSAGVEFKQLTFDTFELISNWYYYGILELTSVEGFNPDPKWIAKAVGISVPEVTIAIERLQRLGLLEIDDKGQFWDRSGNVTTLGSNFSVVALRNLQRQVLEMALTALDEVPIDRRDQTSVTMAINSSLLPEAKERIKAFRRDLAVFLQDASKGNRDEVYQLGISLYPVSQLGRTGKVPVASKLH